MNTCTACSHPNRDAARCCCACSCLLPGVALQKRYRLIRVLNRGDMSTVYLATDQRFGNEPCVIKEMREQFAQPDDRQQAVQMFHNEAVILRRLNHPSVVRVVDHFDEFGRYYLVMDFIEGESLEKFLLREDPNGLPEEQVLGWGIQICDVLEYLHMQQPAVIFRDLKPSNIMLNSSGQLGLVDFGIARFFKPGQTRDTWNMGTPGYAPLEQYGQGQTDARSDVYALGATLHRLLTGRDPQTRPFIFPPVRTLNPALSAGVEGVIAKAVNLEPEGRYQSAQEMSWALQNLMGLFDLDVSFVHPQLHTQSTPLCQFALNVISKAALVSAQSQITTHIVLVLDVSVSMQIVGDNGGTKNVEDEKYKPLLHAVQALIEHLPEHNLLTISLFSGQSDIVVRRKLIAECQSNVRGVISGIDNSNAKFLGKNTLLAPALSLVLDEVRVFQQPGVVHRVYILTDGQIHDKDECEPLFEKMRSLNAETYAFGFGDDWEKEPLGSLLTGCRGGSFKPVAAGHAPGSYNVVDTFRRVAQAGRNIIAADAELQITFAPDVIPGDAFHYMPIARYLGSGAYSDKTFHASIGALERDSSYTYCFEARLQPTRAPSHEIATATLSYAYQGKKITQRQPIVVHRTSDQSSAEQIVRQDTREVFLILEGLRSDDPQTQLLALKARLDILLGQGGDARQIQALRNAIGELTLHGSLNGLSREDLIWVHTDSRGQTTKMADRRPVL